MRPSTIKKRLRSEEGQTLVEYALILGIVSVGAIIALGLLGTTLSNVFTDIAGLVNGSFGS